MGEGRHIKLSQIDPLCLPGHVRTESYEIVSEGTVGAKHFELYLSEMYPGGEAEESVHPTSEHGYYMISGTGEAVVEGETFILNPNECLFIPPGARHGIKPLGPQPIRVLVFFAPPKGE